MSSIALSFCYMNRFFGISFGNGDVEHERFVDRPVVNVASGGVNVDYCAVSSDAVTCQIIKIKSMNWQNISNSYTMQWEKFYNVVMMP